MKIGVGSFVSIKTGYEQWYRDHIGQHTQHESWLKDGEIVRVAGIFPHNMVFVEKKDNPAVGAMLSTGQIDCDRVYIFDRETGKAVMLHDPGATNGLQR